MGETIVKKKELWDLTADSGHVKFYQWMWGVYAPDKYKTACPYYWKFAFSMPILPLIVLSKILGYFITPILDKLKVYFIVRSIENLDIWALRAENATTDEEFYKIYKSKCYSNNMWDKVFNGLRDEIANGYFNHLETLNKSKDIRQAKVDAFKYGAGGTILTYVIGFIIAVLLGWGLYEFVHLFTWSEFKGFSLALILFLVAVAIAIAIIIGLVTAYDNYACSTWVGKITPFKWIGQFFKAIGTGFRMFFDMVKSTYTKSCPTINWK